MRVSDLPEELREACLKIGMPPDRTVTSKEALAKWSKLHHGDETIAHTVLRLHAEALLAADKAAQTDTERGHSPSDDWP